jgi:hypothetical protein
MKDEPKKGEQVIWNRHGGRAEGKVARKITKAMNMKGYHVAASARRTRRFAGPSVTPRHRPHHAGERRRPTF